jgi:hypothetical protein
VWSIAFAYLGLAFGGAALRLLAFTNRLDVKLGFIALLLSIVLVIMMRRRLIGERTARVLTGDKDIHLMTTAEREAARHWPSPRARHD